MRKNNIGAGAGVNDGREILERIVAGVFVQTDAHHVLAAVTQQRVAVGRGLRRDARGERAACTGTVVHHDGLAELIGEFLPHQPRHDVDRPTRRARRQHTDGFVGPLGSIGGRNSARENSQRGKYPSDALHLHVILLRRCRCWRRTDPIPLSAI